MTRKSKTTTKKTQPKQTNASSGAGLRPWSDLDAKKEVFEIIIGRILMDPSLGEEYEKNPEKARNDIKELIQVPDEVKIVFLPERDSETQGGGSVVIELPPTDPEKRARLEKMELFLCTYNPW
jgi:hypothetical protein